MRSLIGVAFIPLNAYLVVQLETVWGIGDPTTMTIFFNAIFCFFLVIVLNLLLTRWIPKNALNRGELLTIYSILMVSVSVSGQDFTHTIFGTLGNARWFATPENEWATLFLSYLPQWLEPSEKALEGYFFGRVFILCIKEHQRMDSTVSVVDALPNGPVFCDDLHQQHHPPTVGRTGKIDIPISLLTF